MADTMVILAGDRSTASAFAHEHWDGIYLMMGHEVQGPHTVWRVVLYSPSGPVHFVRVNSLYQSAEVWCHGSHLGCRLAHCAEDGGSLA